MSDRGFNDHLWESLSRQTRHLIPEFFYSEDDDVPRGAMHVIEVMAALIKNGVVQRDGDLLHSPEERRYMEYDLTTEEQMAYRFIENAVEGYEGDD